METQKIDLVEILKDCPKGTKLYSPLFGEVKFKTIDITMFRPIEIETYDDKIYHFSREGKVLMDVAKEGTESFECMLFPSSDNKDWATFKTSCFDIKSLKPFDKILVRWDNGNKWACALFSYYFEEEENIVNPYKFVCADGDSWRQCVPYNEDTANLIGTTKEPKKFYRWWDKN